jgi:deoxyribodipyrimidine photo-lyase
MIYQYTNQHYENLTKEPSSILFQDCIGIATLFKSLKTNVEWSLKTLIELMMFWLNQKTKATLKLGKKENGVPIVDACMRCLVATGYINFRMRAMVVSFHFGKIGESCIFSETILDYEPDSLSANPNAIWYNGHQYNSDL